VPEAAHAELVREYGELSPDGPAHADTVLEKLLTLWKAEPDIPAESLAAIAAPALVMAGEHDIVARAHTESIAAAIPGAQLAFIPGASHLLIREQPAAVAARILGFLG
jgi:pimeloyl-ACP methyl ester carboxylesterase